MIKPSHHPPRAFFFPSTASALPTSAARCFSAAASRSFLASPRSSALLRSCPPNYHSETETSSVRSEGVRGWCNQSRWLAVIQSANGAVWANAVRGLKTGRKKGQARGLVTSAGSAPAGNSLKNYAHMAEHLVPNRVCVPGELKKGAGRTLPSNKACTELRHEDSTERISCVFSSRCCFATPEFVFNTTDSYVRSDASLLRGELSGGRAADLQRQLVRGRPSSRRAGLVDHTGRVPGGRQGLSIRPGRGEHHLSPQRRSVRARSVNKHRTASPSHISVCVHVCTCASA